MCGYKTKILKDTVTLFRHRIDLKKKKKSCSVLRVLGEVSSILLSNRFSFHVQHSDAKSIHQSMHQSNYTKVVTKHVTHDVTHVCLSICSRHFISFPSCWLCCTHGSQRAQSRGGEQDPQKNRIVR